MNIKLIKKIRKITSISIDKCKKALEKNNYNLNKSIIYLKKKKNKIKKLIKEGNIYGKIKNNKAIMIQINCETDFTIKHIEIKKLVNKIINYSFKKNYKSINKIKKKFKKKINYLISKFNENIEIKKFLFIKGKFLTQYIHNNNKIGTILKIKTNKLNINKEKIKKIAMHITAMNPKFINKKKIPLSKIKKYRQNIIFNLNSKNIKNNIIKIKLIEKINNVSLLEQKFIFNNKISVKEYINKNKITIINFWRFQI